MDSLVIIIFAIVAIGLVSVIAKSLRADKDERPGQGKTDDHRRGPVANAQQVAEDIKMTQTSRVVDAVAVLEDLGKTQPGYRHYAELIGTAQPTSSVTAPYSQRGVAYYDLRAFRVERLGGRDVETLVAHEKSIEPFWFTDGSCDTRVYVDLDSFGDNIILVNSANRVEGPDSKFASAFGSAAGGGNGGGRGPRTAMAIIGSLRDRAAGLLATLRERARMPRLAPAPAPALALAAGTALPFQRTEAFVPAAAVRHGARGGLAFDWDDFGGPGPGGPGGFGDFGHLGDFLGPNPDMGHVGGPHGGYWGDGHSSTSDVLLGMGLGALVGQVVNNMGGNDDYQPQDQGQFRGYRIVEDVVPLNQPVYALGELYKNGPAVTIGRSVSQSYPSSFFATKPEAEIIAHLRNQ